MENEIMTTHVTFRDYLKVLFRRKRIIAVVVAAMVATVFAGLQLKTPVYESRVTMFIMATKQIDSLYYKNAPEMRPTNMALTQSEIVRSNPVIERVVGRLGLDELADDYEKPFATPLKSLLIDIKSAGALQKLSSLPETDQRKIRFRKAVEALKKKTKVEPVRETDLFVVTVADFDPVMAARLANAVSRSYCIFDIEQQLAELQQKYGDKHLFVMQLKDNLVKMEKELTDDTLSNIDAIGPASVKIIEQAGVAIEPTGKSKKTILLVTVIMSLMLGVILAFVYEGFDTTIRSSKDMEGYLKAPLLGYVPEYISLPGKAGLLFAELLSWCGWALPALLFVRFLLSGVPSVTDNPIARSVFDASEPLLILTGAGYFVQPDGADFRVLFAGVILLAASMAVVRLARNLSRRRSARKMLVNIKKDKNEYAQAYVNLAEQVYTALKNNSRKSALITASLSGEGATSVTGNLGMLLAAKPGNRVLIIDANMRKPGVHRLFGIKQTDGLAGILTGDSSLAEAIVAVPGQQEEQLFILPAGKSTGNSLVLFDAEKIASVIKQAEEQFDVVLVDSPNLRKFKDGVSISASVDSVVFVAGEGRSRKELILHVLSLLERKKARIIGGVLNHRKFTIPHFLYERS